MATGSGELGTDNSSPSSIAWQDLNQHPSKSKARLPDVDVNTSVKRRCCDGNIPSCAACASVYGTRCIYDPNSDHRRKGVYKKDIDNLKTRNSTLQTLIEAILNFPEDEVAELVRQIRNCDSLDDVAESITAKESGAGTKEDFEETLRDVSSDRQHTFEAEISGKMGELRIEDGSVRYIGGTSNMIFLEGNREDSEPDRASSAPEFAGRLMQQDEAIASWTTVTSDVTLIVHLVKLYFTWHYTYFTTLSKHLFFRDFLLGDRHGDRKRTCYCSPMLVNAILALGCHFTAVQGSRADPDQSSTAGDHFFKEAKRLIVQDDEYEKPKLTTVQALALMSVREAGCGREAKGWVYSGMSFRMAWDMGLNLESDRLAAGKESTMDEEEVDARRITFWGCFLFDKCWSNYLGRQPQLQLSNTTVAKIEVFPTEDSDAWTPYSDSGPGQDYAQPARTRAVALKISELCEISSDLLTFFYRPTSSDKPIVKSLELKKLGELHTRLEAWKRNLPKEMEPREGSLPNILVMHMFYQLLFIHLFRPFLKYNQSTSPLPAHVSPRKLCTQAATLISKLLRLYKRTYGLRQIVNVAVYIAHSACTIHLLNHPDKNARRDIVHGVKHLEEVAEGWIVALRTLSVLMVLVRRWDIDIPSEARVVLERAEAKYGQYCADDSVSHRTSSTSPHITTVNSPAAPSPSDPSGHGGVFNGDAVVDFTSTNNGMLLPPSSASPTFDASSYPSLSSVHLDIPHAIPQFQSQLGIPQVSAPQSPPPPPQPPTSSSPSTTSSSFRNLFSTHQSTRGSSGPDTGGIMLPPQPYSSINGLNGIRSLELTTPSDREWWFKDQSALATDLGNWNGIDTSAADQAILDEVMNGGDDFGINSNAFSGFDTADWFPPS
ncbi:MAG: hypothetical protein M1825_005645 [Sarcosagium campestre]|nr:MAG: hypothetical protein M1825_005645 [Sarcosagium campestre]